MDTYAVIDFETTGKTPAHGARGTEIAAVLVQGGRIVDQYASLMGSDATIPPFIEDLTGISTAMIRSAPPAALRRSTITVSECCATDRGRGQAE